MQERSIPYKREQGTSHLKVDSSLMRRIRDSKVVIFRAVCEGRWDKTRVAILESGKKSCRQRSVEVEVGMKLAEFHQTIRPGREIIFYGRHALEDDDGNDIIFAEKGEPRTYAGEKAVFRVEKIVRNEGFREKNPLSEGPETDMD